MSNEKCKKIEMPEKIRWIYLQVMQFKKRAAIISFPNKEMIAKIAPIAYGKKDSDALIFMVNYMV